MTDHNNDVAQKPREQRTAKQIPAFTTAMAAESLNTRTAVAFNGQYLNGRVPSDVILASILLGHKLMLIRICGKRATLWKEVESPTYVKVFLSALLILAYAWEVSPDGDQFKDSESIFNFINEVDMVTGEGPYFAKHTNEISQLFDAYDYLVMDESTFRSKHRGSQFSRYYYFETIIQKTMKKVIGDKTQWTAFSKRLTDNAKHGNVLDAIAKKLSIDTDLW